MGLLDKARERVSGRKKSGAISDRALKKVKAKEDASDRKNKRGKYGKYAIPKGDGKSVTVNSTSSLNQSESTKGGFTENYQSDILNTDASTGVESRLNIGENTVGSDSVITDNYSKYDPKTGNFQQETYDSSDGLGYKSSEGSLTLDPVHVTAKRTPSEEIDGMAEGSQSVTGGYKEGS